MNLELLITVSMIAAPYLSPKYFMTSRKPDLVPLPALPVDFPELRALSQEKLEQLEVNPLSLDDFILNMAVVQKYSKAKAETDRKRYEICRKSVAYNFDIDESREELSSASTRLGEARRKTQESNAERDSLMSKYTPKNLMHDLDKVAESCETVTNELMSSFTSVEAAKAEFLSQRVLYHKAMALSDLISSHGSRSQITTPAPYQRI
jgi:tRNA G10  N-methylase Trm11